MSFDAAPPAIHFPVYDPRPIIEIVSEAPEPAIAANLRQAVERVEQELSPHRRALEIAFRDAETAILRAEQAGWFIDCSQIMKAVRDAHANCTSTLREAEGFLKATVRRAVAARVPGANTMNSYALRFSTAVNGLLNDFDDYEDSISRIQKRMASAVASATVQRSAAAYASAIKTRFSIEAEHEIQIDPTAGGPYIRFDIPLDASLLSDPVQVLAVEQAVHDDVARANPDLVGKVALNYVAA